MMKQAITYQNNGAENGYTLPRIIEKIPITLLLIGCLMMLLVACSADETTLTPTKSASIPTATSPPLSESESATASPESKPAQEQDNPPFATLTNGTAETQAALGSYCWRFNEDKPIECSNVFTIFASSVPLHVSRGEKLTISLPDKPLMFVTMRVLEWETINADTPTGYTAIAQDAPMVASGDLEPVSTIEWEAPPIVGEYMLDLMSVYENEGNIGYGWHILVE